MVFLPLIFVFERWGEDSKTWASFTLQKKKESLYIHKNFNIFFNKKKLKVKTLAIILH